ncbi:MAG: UDP-N-acetylglucosamine 2-epimerase (non-hydrolyzing) [bacterium]|nr:UDP-N-acetylglucosamine 2-epimerase (non-hydrolyzing) [bacterium]
MTILGTRPEIIRMSRILPRLDEYFRHIFVYTNQSYDYELSKIFFEELRIRKADYLLEVQAPSLGSQIGNILSQTEKVMHKESPDGILILGDTNSALSAIMAKRLKIPIFHMEAGNRSFDWNVPEEINRRIVDHISDYNLAYTEHSRRYLLAENIPPQNVFVTGTPLAEVLHFYQKEIQNSPILNELHLSGKKYFLVSAHREENVDSKEVLSELLSTLNWIAEEYDHPIIVSLHPRTKQRLRNLHKKLDKRIIFHTPFGFFAYNKLQENAFCVLSDSGSIQEESAIADFPAVQIRVSTERPEAFDSGSIVLCGVQKEGVSVAIKIATAMQRELPMDYRSKNVSEKVVRIIAGFASLRKKS